MSEAEIIAHQIINTGTALSKTVLIKSRDSEAEKENFILSQKYSGNIKDLILIYKDEIKKYNETAKSNGIIKFIFTIVINLVALYVGYYLWRTENLLTHRH